MFDCNILMTQHRQKQKLQAVKQKMTFISCFSKPLFAYKSRITLVLLSYCSRIDLLLISDYSLITLLLLSYYSLITSHLLMKKENKMHLLYEVIQSSTIKQGNTVDTYLYF